MSVRAALTASLVLALATTGTASAKPKAPKPVCNLVTDGKNDTFALRTQTSLGTYGPQEDALDIVSMDIASNAKTVTGVIRVLGLGATPRTSPYGTSYEIEWTVPGSDNHYYFAAARTVKDGDTFSAGYRSGSLNTATKLADATGRFDVEHNEIRVSTPVATFNGQGKGMQPGVKISFGGLDQTASRNAGVSVFADVASSGAVYLTGAPSCVVPGR